MKLGIFNHPDDTDGFVRDLIVAWQPTDEIEQFVPRQVTAPIFYERLKRRALQRDLDAFIVRQDVLFFEWTSAYLAHVSHMPKIRPIVARLHRFEMFTWVDRINWDNVDCLILVSEAMRQKFCTRFPAHGHITTVIPEAIAVERFPLHSKPFGGDIGTMCHLTPRKRVYELMLSFAELQKIRPKTHLHIGGGEHPAYGDYYDALQGLVGKLNLQDSVTFYGHISDASAWYQNIDVYVSNAYSEGLQVGPIEAMASGAYCLAHWWDGADELLPQSHLYHSSEQLQQRLVHYLDLSAEARQAEHTALRERVLANFDVQLTAPRFRDIFAQVSA